MITPQSFKITAEDLNQWENTPSQNSSSKTNNNPAPQTNTQPSNNSTWYGSNFNDPLLNTIYGAGDAIRNTVASGLNMIPGVYINPVKSGQGTAYNIGNIAGNIGAFMGGGDLLDAARAGAEVLPYVGDTAKWLGGQSSLQNIARQGLGSAAYGLAATNDNRLGNAEEGGIVGGALGALPGISGKIAQGLGYLNPQNYVKSIVNDMSGGQTLGDATKSVLASIKQAYEKQIGDSRGRYSDIDSSVPVSNIYENVNGSKNTDPLSSIYSKPDQNLSGEYPNISKDTLDNYTSGLKDLHNNFLKNPTYRNAQKLQSELGTVSSQLRSGSSAPTISTIDSANSLMDSRAALKNDINSFLNRNNPELLDKYNKASENFQQNVVPYRTNPTLYSIAKGETTNISPSALANIFKSPNEDMQTILSHLPDDTVDKILYTKLGKDTPSNNPFAFLRAYGRLQEQGLGDYISPDLQEKIDSLQNRIKWRSTAQAGIGAAAGAHSGLGHALGAISGGAVASPLLNYLGRRLQLQKVGNALSTGAQYTYSPLSTAIKANLLNNSGVQNNGS